MPLPMSQPYPLNILFGEDDVHSDGCSMPHRSVMVSVPQRVRRVFEVHLVQLPLT